MLDLLAAQARVDGDEHRSRRRHPVVRFEHRRDVRSEEGDAIAALDPRGMERGSQTIHPFVELPIRRAPLTVHDRDLVGEDVGAATEETHRRELCPVGPPTRARRWSGGVHRHLPVQSTHGRNIEQYSWWECRGRVPGRRVFGDGRFCRCCAEAAAEVLVASTARRFLRPTTQPATAGATAAASRPSSTATPPVGPSNASTACSGCGIRPRTLPASFVTPAIRPTAPFTSVS